MAIKSAIDNFALERLQVGIAIIFGNDFDRFFEYATEKVRRIEEQSGELGI